MAGLELEVAAVRVVGWRVPGGVGVGVGVGSTAVTVTVGLVALE